MSHILPFDNFQVARLFYRSVLAFNYFRIFCLVGTENNKWEMSSEYEPGNEYVEGK